MPKGCSPTYGVVFWEEEFNEIKLTIYKPLTNIFMRTLFLILSVVSITLFSCSSNDDDSIRIEESLIHPPDWIQGTWSSRTEGSEYDRLRFTKDDFLLFQGGAGISNKELVEGHRNAGLPVEIEEEIEEDRYKITTHYYEEEPTTYTFLKETSTEILWVEAEVTYER